MYGRSTAAPHVRNQFNLLVFVQCPTKIKGPTKIAGPSQHFSFNFQLSTPTTQCGASVVIEYAFGFPNLIAVIPLCTSFT
jgi:hypothetical protein